MGWEALGLLGSCLLPTPGPQEVSCEGWLLEEFAYKVLRSWSQTDLDLNLTWGIELLSF